MSEEQQRGLKAIIASAQIEEIRLVRVVASTSAPPRSETQDLSVSVQQKFAASVKEHRNEGLTVLAELDLNLFRALSEDSTVEEDVAAKGLLVSVHAEFELLYTLPPKLSAEAKDFEEFARVNGVFNAWPYFREFVQSTFSRMNLPAFVLPLLRVSGKQPEDQTKAVSHHRPAAAT